MLCTCHCAVKSRFSQIGQYKCIIIFVTSCIKYILVAMVVDYSLSVSTLVVHQTGHLHHLCCTCHHHYPHLMRVVIVVRVRVVTLVVMVVRSLVRWCGDRSGRDHLTALATWLSSLVLATNNQSTTSPSSTATAQAHLTPQSRTRPPHDPEH